MSEENFTIRWIEESKRKSFLGQQKPGLLASTAVLEFMMCVAQIVRVSVGNVEEGEEGE